ncbi:MAG TPA: RNA methyltransferase [Vicinamibacterales bacterium]|nr:RNA methyltransferase [Vicinamibacterales bacterium]
METITSRQNPIVRRFRAAADGARESVLLDGAHLIEEALAASAPIELVAIEEGAKADVAALGRRVETAGARVIRVPSTVLAAMSPVRQPSGIVAIARRQDKSLAQALAASPQMVLILDEVQDPGNVGAVVRAAEACGATGVITGQGTADPMGWKALRGSMGSIFRLPVAVRQNLADAVRAARALGIEIIAAVPRDGVLLPELDLRRPVAVLLGGEGGGLRDSVVELATTRLTIPMRRPVESLNVATAAALIAYEAQRQRASVLS